MTLTIQSAKLSNMLTIIATPIGNLKDITLRAIETLQQVDGIICEDTRRTSLLLNHYQIKKPLYVLNDFNEFKGIPSIIDRLIQGQNLALVSDAGTPLISDPGFKLVRQCLKEKIEVDSIPGPVAAVDALTLSGLPTDKFTFLGYLPEKPGHRIQMLKKISEINKVLGTTFVIYVAPHKLLKTLDDIQTTFGDIDLTLAKELTKIHQKMETGSISRWRDLLQKAKPKGEYVLLFNLSQSP